MVPGISSDRTVALRQSRRGKAVEQFYLLCLAFNRTQCGVNLSRSQVSMRIAAAKRGEVRESTDDAVNFLLICGFDVDANERERLRTEHAPTDCDASSDKLWCLSRDAAGY